MNYKTPLNIVRLLLCAALMAAVAVNNSGNLLGHDLTADASDTPAGYITGDADNYVVNTTGLADNITGYGGTTPLEITVTGGRISQVTPLDNDETPGFFSRVKEEVLPRYIGLTPAEVADADIDAVSGATMSSTSVIETMKRSMAYAADNEELLAEPATDLTAVFSVKTVAALIIVLAGAIVPLIFRDQRYRLLQLILNVAILGLWCGTFLSYSLIVNFLSNGTNVIISIVPIVMLVTAFIYPLLGKRGHYCAWICPLGSLQELSGRCVKRKLPLSPATVKWLGRFRLLLWCVLTALLLTGLCTSWMGYELFTAFLFEQASWVVIALALAFVALSLVVNRPYCRFVCPTGTLAKLAQGDKWGQ